MLNFKKLFLGFLFSVLFSAVLIAVCAFMILKLGFLPSEPILGTAAVSYTHLDVYKRQGIGIPIKIDSIKLEARLLSYT